MRANISKKFQNLLPFQKLRFGFGSLKENLNHPDPLHQFCQSAPKVELHAHLHGCIRKTTLQTYLSEKRVAYSKDEFNTKDMKGAFRIFDLIHAAINDLKQIERIAQEMFEDFQSQGTVYLEMRTTPRSMGEKSADDYVRTVLDQIIKFESKNSMKIRLLLSVSRAEDITKAKETLALARKYKSTGYILGIDYSGNPFQKNFSYFREVFDEARASGLKTVVHCAELPDQKTLQETYTVLDFKPDRLGHFNYFNEELFKIVHDLNIPIEMCPTSNKFTMYLSDYKDHHFIQYFKTKHPLCLCTDDTVVFDTNITEEYYRMLKAFNLGIQDAKDIIKRSYQCILDDQVKENLLKLSM